MACDVPQAGARIIFSLEVCKNNNAEGWPRNLPALAMAHDTVE